MKKLFATFILMISIALGGCASVFEEEAYWPDSAYGGTMEKIALEGFREHHSRWKTDVKTSPSMNRTWRTDADMHINPLPTASCVTHSVWSAKELESRGEKYEVVLFKVTDGLWHSVIKQGDKILDINTREPYSYSENYKGRYMQERNLGYVKSKNVRGVLTALGYTYKT